MGKTYLRAAGLPNANLRLFNRINLNADDELVLVVKPAKNSNQRKTRADYQCPEGYHACVRAEKT